MKFDINEIVMRLSHYGPGPHKGTGTSQDVHGGNGHKPLLFGQANTIDELTVIQDRKAYFIRPNGVLVDVHAFGDMATHTNVLRDHPELFDLKPEDVAGISAYSLFPTLEKFDLMRVVTTGKDAVTIDLPSLDYFSVPKLSDLQELYDQGKLPTLRDYGSVIVSWGDSNGYNEANMTFREFRFGGRLRKRSGRWFVNMRHQHYGPGPHKSGSPQSAHGKGGTQEKPTLIKWPKIELEIEDANAQKLLLERGRVSYTSPLFSKDPMFPGGSSITDYSGLEWWVFHPKATHNYKVSIVHEFGVDYDDIPDAVAAAWGRGINTWQETHQELVDYGARPKRSKPRSLAEELFKMSQKLRQHG